MIKKIFLNLFLFLFITNCGFTPLYSNKKTNDIDIEIISYEGDREINLNLLSKIETNNNPNGKLYKIAIVTKYEKTTLTNNLAGEPEEYQLLSTAKFTIVRDNFQKKLNVSEKFVMKNFTDDFEEKNYETNIKNNMTNLIYNKLLLQIDKLK